MSALREVLGLTPEKLREAALDAAAIGEAITREDTEAIGALVMAWQDDAAPLLIALAGELGRLLAGTDVSAWAQCIRERCLAG